MHHFARRAAFLGVALVVGVLLFASASGVASANPGPYQVQPTDTLWGIAYRNPQTTFYCIASKNRLSPPEYRIYAGTTIIVPDNRWDCSPNVYAFPPGGGSTGDKHQRNGCEHLVKPGENLYRIAVQYGTSVWAIALENGFTNPNYVYAGQVLQIPGCKGHK